MSSEAVHGFQQVYGDLALVDCGGHDAPGPHDPAAKVRLDRQPEAVEPFSVRGVTAEPGGQVVAGTGPLVRAATAMAPELIASSTSTYT
jgi:hypothetical protein